MVVAFKMQVRVQHFKLESDFEARPPAECRAGRYITRPKSRIMRVTRQLGLPPRIDGLNLATLEYSTRRIGRATQKSECAMSPVT